VAEDSAVSFVAIFDPERFGLDDDNGLAFRSVDVLVKALPAAADSDVNPPVDSYIQVVEHGLNMNLQRGYR